jgi:uncharacterized membrane protein YgdD (TMEM256/DUF423 family)
MRPPLAVLLCAHAVLGALGVALGAFGAHALRDTLGPRELAIWQTAVQYHLLHAALGVAVTLGGRAGALTERAAAGVGWCWAAGVLLFAGSLYALALGGPRLLGPVTPLGGLFFIVGWLWLACAARKK